MTCAVGGERALVGVLGSFLSDGLEVIRSLDFEVVFLVGVCLVLASTRHAWYADTEASAAS